MIFLYNLLFPFVFIFFVPAIVFKLIKRGGVKNSFYERFSFYSRKKKEKFKLLKHPVVWIHAVSVGETQLVIDFIKTWRKKNPSLSFVISTTTTTGQELAQNKLRDMCTVIFCPIDYFLMVRRTLQLIKPEILVIFETEIWPAMIYEAKKRGMKVVQVNARISDHSFKGYKKFAYFIRPFLSLMDVSCAQTNVDVERLKTICPSLNVVKTGTMKFDQSISSNLLGMKLDEFFGKGDFIYILAASTHEGEEKLIAGIYKNLVRDFNNLRLIIVPRHAERGGEIAGELRSLGLSYFRRSSGGKSSSDIKCLIADTTGEMLAFMKVSDIVIMGKCFVGNDGGHNVIEPALLGKPIITGKELSNFRFVMRIMRENDALISVDDSGVESALRKLIEDPEERKLLGARAKDIVSQHIGATEKTINEIEKCINCRQQTNSIHEILKL